MKVLVVGGGGREHALVWKLSTSPRVKKIFCAPGNAGTAALAENVPIAAEEIEALADFAQGEGIDLTVVGPEAPLVAGIVDLFQERGLAVFGPTAAAAALEGSKVFAKELMDRYGIPTAKFAVFDDYKKAQAYIQQVGVPIVVKAEGLAAGKGVVVAREEEAALEAVYEIMEGQIYGAAGRRVVIEECLEGEEVTLLALTDGENVSPWWHPRTINRSMTRTGGPIPVGWAVILPFLPLPRPCRKRFTTPSCFPLCGPCRIWDGPLPVSSMPA